MAADKRQTSKIFVGGLSWETTDARLRTYFENYGAVSEAFVSFDRTTGRPRGFGFVVFEDPAVADKVVSLQHTIDRRDVEAKKAVPKEENPGAKTANGVSPARTKKIFVGGLAPSVDEAAFRKYFEQFGQVDDAVVMYDHDNKRPRGFGFVTFATEEAVDAVFTGGSLQTLHDKPIEIKRAVPRDQIASARGRPGAFQQQPRMFAPGQRMNGSQSGFAAAAMGPAFGGESGPRGNGGLLTSHSLGVPNSQSHAHQALAGALSLGAAGLPAFPPDLAGALSQGLAAGLLGAMSGQLSGQLPHSAAFSRAASAHLPLGGHLDEFLPQVGGQRLGGNGFGNGHLSSASSGIPQAFSSGNSGLLGGEFGLGNGYSAAAASGLESAFAGLALDPPPRALASELPPPNGFEERVSMLSAGSAGLGQLHSPSVTAAFGSGYADSQKAGREVTVSSQQW